MIVDMSIVFGLASLTFAGVKDVVLKRQASRCTGSGTYIAVVGTVWMLFFSLFGLSQGSLPVPSVLKWGLIAGTLSVSADYLLIRSLRDLDAGIAVTIYRLNLVPAALMAVILLAEPFSLLKALGLTAGVIAVILFCGNRNRHPHKIHLPAAALICVIAASLLRACMGIVYKVASDSYTSLASGGIDCHQAWFLGLQGAMWLVGGTLVSFGEGRTRWTKDDVVTGVITGLLICGTVLFLAKALAIGQAVVIIAISQMSFLVTALLSWLFMKEHFSTRKTVGLACAIIAIIVLSIATE